MSRGASWGGKPFVVLTFDDGYCDFETFALPILERHSVPATLFITTGFADRTVTPWWSALEEVIRSEQSLCLALIPQPIGFATDTPTRKLLAFKKIKKILLQMDQRMRAEAIFNLTFNCGISENLLIEKTCLNWHRIRTLSKNSLLTIGAHTISHPLLAQEDAYHVLTEIARSRDIIENNIEKPVQHFAYPSGCTSAVGQREFSMTKAMGFITGLTTRPGLIYERTLLSPHNLPRVSLNGHFQNLDVVDILLSGIPFLR
jgi:peptidoglycan/xylan/chitin deacetylase (PgdA/CDA1 family)